MQLGESIEIKLKVLEKEMCAKEKSRSRSARIVRRLLFRLILLGVLAGLMGVSILWARNTILARQVQTVISQEGSLEADLEVAAWVINTEQVVTSNKAGKVDKLAAEGERVRRGGPVARVYPASGSRVDLASPSSGLISFTLDGLEGILTPKNLLEWNLEKFKDLKPEAQGQGSVQGGQGAFKVVDNLLPTYLLFGLPGQQADIALGGRMNFRLGEQRFSGKVVKIASDGSKRDVAVVLDSFLPQSFGHRQIKLGLLVENPDTGVVLPLAALVEREGKKGIYIIKEGTVAWQEVAVKAQTTDQVCLDKVKTGIPVITTPEYVHDGQIIKIN